VDCSLDWSRGGGPVYYSSANVSNIHINYLLSIKKTSFETFIYQLKNVDDHVTSRGR